MSSENDLLVLLNKYRDAVAFMQSRQMEALLTVRHLRRASGDVTGAIAHDQRRILQDFTTLFSAIEPERFAAMQATLDGELEQRDAENVAHHKQNQPEHKPRRELLREEIQAADKDTRAAFAAVAMQIAQRIGERLETLTTREAFETAILQECQNWAKTDGRGCMPELGQAQDTLYLTVADSINSTFAEWIKALPHRAPSKQAH